MTKLSRSENVALDLPLAVLHLAILALALALLWPAPAIANSGVVPLFWYGSSSDNHLGKETAFASWWCPPNIPLLVRDDYPGVALRGYAPGTKVRITVVGLPGWAESWPELSRLVGNVVIAYVADRPGGSYGDAWQYTFQELAPLWIGKLYVEIEVIE